MSVEESTPKTDKGDGSTAPDVAVIVLNLNGADHLRNLFSSFMTHNTYPNVKFVVVEHGSSDKSLQVLLQYRKKLPIKIWLCTENDTFSKSNNLAVNSEDSKYLFFLNNDIIFQNDVITHMVTSLETDPGVGVVGARLLYPNHHKAKPGQVQHMGIRFSLDGMVNENSVRYFSRYPELQKTPFYSDRPKGARDHYEAQGKKEGFVYEDLTFLRPYNSVAQPRSDLVPCVTGAAFLCRRDDFQAVGGLFEGYDYGYEDVDFCLNILARLRKQSKLASDVVMIHDESATQKKDPPVKVQKRRLANCAMLKQRFGLALKKAYFLDLLEQSGFWTDDPMTIAFAVTDDDPNTKAGDFFTASELAEACRKKLGWKVTFVARNKDWYDMSGVDVLINLLDSYDLNQIHHDRPHLVKMAWARNWFDRWAKRPWFNQYDVYLCSSRKAADYFFDHYGKPAHVLPIATNAEKFKNAVPNEKFDCDYCFTGSYWNADRDIEQTLDPEQIPHEFALFGGGWDNHHQFNKYCRGFVAYSEMPAIYAATKLVIDDANHVTKPWGSVNSRVFDALAAGKLVISNGAEGTRAIFGDLLPTYETKEELKKLLCRYLADDDTRNVLAKRLQKTVLRHHTYEHRAIQLRDILINFMGRKLRLAIKVPVPKIEVAHQWGDYYFALALKRSFEREGHSVRIDILPDWDKTPEFTDDVVLVLRGLSCYEPKPAHLNLMWNISHPDKISDEEYESYDHVFVASVHYARELDGRLNVPVTPLLQCTDPALFYNDADPSVPAEPILFVGNSRKQYRHGVKACIDSNLPIAVYGNYWQSIIPDHYVKGIHIPNEELRRYYSRCEILLNDHWPSMSANGFISNRIFDGGACGACVVSDFVEGAEDVFGDALTLFCDGAELSDITRRLSADKKKRRELGDRLRDIVLKHHTFDHRVRQMMDVIDAHPKSITFETVSAVSSELPSRRYSHSDPCP